MQIIVVHPRKKQDKQFTLTGRHLACAVVLLLMAVFISAFLLSFLLFRGGNDGGSSFLQEPSIDVKLSERSGGPRYAKENMALVMIKLGEMQARMMRLDSLGERVQALAGIHPETFNFNEIPGRGGFVRANAAAGVAPDVTMAELQKAIDALESGIEQRSDYLNAVEAALISMRNDGKLQSVIQPIDGAYNSSSFGPRVDPFTGHTVFHEGVDFAAPYGTPIIAAAGGVVVSAGQHEQYGNMVDISHGGDVVTRYAHASKLHVKAGDLVRQGQHIADVGSTGRSTGAHLHFEVQVRNMVQDPRVFLSRNADPIRLAARTAN